MQAYQNNKVGTLLFVCEIVDVDTYQLYYANLLPIDIKDILEKSKGKTSTSFKIIPIDSDEDSVKSLKSICLNFLRESRKQINIPIKHVEEENIKEINFQVNIPGNKYDLSKIVKSDLYLYATTKDGEKIALPKAETYYAGQDIIANISIDGVKYYDRFKRVFSSEQKEYMKIGQAVSINVKNSSITFTPKGNIENRIRDLSFFLKFYENEYFDINDEKMRFKIDKSHKIDKYKTMLDDLQKTKEAIDYFEIDLNENLDLIDAQSILNLNKITNFYFGNITKDIKEMQIYYMDISKTRLVFYIIKDEVSNRFKIMNFFKENDIRCFIDKIQISKYMFLAKQDINFLLKCNINYSDMVNSLKKYYCKELVTEYNQMELILIKCFDKQRNEKLLVAIENLNDFILQNEENDSRYIEIVNKMQIIKRKRPLSFEEQKAINDLTISEDNENYKKLQCAKDILLDRDFDLKLHFSKMSDTEKNEFKEMPIYNLIKKGIL